MTSLKAASRVLIFFVTLSICNTGMAQNPWESLFRNLGGASSTPGIKNSQETIYIINSDGRHYVSFSGNREAGSLDMIVDKGDKPEDYLYFFPPGIRVASYNAKNDVFKIPPGGSSSMSEGKLKLSTNADGTVTHKSDTDCNYFGNRKYCGIWNSSGFQSFALAFILPENIEATKWKTNVDNRGKWFYKHPVLRFMATRVNEINFEITYRVRESAVQDMETLP